MLPTFDPLTFHWYEGVVPPLVGVAVKVTLLPAHAVDDGLAAIATLAVTTGFTRTLAVLLVLIVEVHTPEPIFVIVIFVVPTGKVPVVKVPAPGLPAVNDIEAESPVAEVAPDKL